MITICIPIYNQDVRTLVDTIIDQCEIAAVPFQILCFDDGSKQDYKDINAELCLKLNVNYTELAENVGRARIRNKMARIARYDFMLFLDGDSGIERADFMQKYIDLVYKQSIVYGGRYYQKSKPEQNRLLHLNYGKEFESKHWQQRARNPFLSFMTNNFMVTAKVMHEFPFDEEIKSYGYEDLEWAERVQKSGLYIFHIDNPTIHLGIETNSEFIQKTSKSILNLVDLYRQNKVTNSRLIKRYNQLKKIGILDIVYKLLMSGHAKREANLIEGRASLLTFQLFKLGLFIQSIKG